MTEGAFQDLLQALVDIQMRTDSTRDGQTLATAVEWMATNKTVTPNAAPSTTPGLATVVSDKPVAFAVAGP